ncbi:MAG: 4Fe-4S dicluster domain-containing protein [Deltaproteobacteria bacterium]|nr:4Fe-4S dicluster domain-containing protein [Deltaproteobacteria bacterium]
MVEIQREHPAASDEAGRPDILAAVRKLIQPCIQCGTCTGSCPNEFAMDCTPRMLWRLVLRGEVDEIFNSRTFALCSSCYSCTLRCPRQLPVTEAMAALKQVAARLCPDRYRSSTAFSKTFMDSVRRHGRVNEMEFMFFYFVSRKNPLLPFRFSPMGLRLMRRGKVKMSLPGLGGNDVLAPLFRAVERLEGTP